LHEPAKESQICTSPKNGIEALVNAMTSGLFVINGGMTLRKLISKIKIKVPTTSAIHPDTLAVVFAASARPSPINVDTRVDAAIEIGKCIMKAVAVIVERIVWAARCSREMKLDDTVIISNAMYSAKTMTALGTASLTIGHQFWNAAIVNSFQHSYPAIQ
jgi:hypothetical protein